GAGWKDDFPRGDRERLHAAVERDSQHGRSEAALCRGREWRNVRFTGWPLARVYAPPDESAAGNRPLSSRRNFAAAAHAHQRGAAVENHDDRTGISDRAGRGRHADPDVYFETAWLRGRQKISAHVLGARRAAG